MDKTLHGLMRLAPDNAMQTVLDLAATCRRYEGTFTLLWHKTELQPLGSDRGTSNLCRLTGHSLASGSAMRWNVGWRARRVWEQSSRRRALVACLVGHLVLGVLLLGAPGCSGASTQADATSGPPGAAFSSGSLIGADSLSNTRIGGPYKTVLAYRFRAAWTGVVRAVRIHVTFNTGERSGYSGGTYGVLRVALMLDRPDRRHTPARRALASAVMRPSPQDEWPLVRFARPAHVVAGRLYHVVFTNLDRNPRRNYTSVNSFVQHGHGEATPRVPARLATLLGTARDGGKTPSRWGPRANRRHDRYVPILEVVGGRPEQRIGVGYMEAWVSRPKTIGGAARVRQLFRAKPSRPTQITGAWLRVYRLNPNSAPLELRLETPEGSALASASVAAARIPRASPKWLHVRFRPPVRLSPGRLVALTAAASQQSAYATFPVRKGEDFGFDARTFFVRGYAQFTNGAGWTGWDQWGEQDRRDSDLQFALDIR